MVKTMARMNIIDIFDTGHQIPRSVDSSEYKCSLAGYMMTMV